MRDGVTYKCTGCGKLKSGYGRCQNCGCNEFNILASPSDKAAASCGIAVDGKEFNALLKRFRHLLESETIRQYDEVNPHTGEYVRDIRELDTLVGVDAGSCKHKSVVRIGSKDLDASDIASAIATWAKVNGYRIYSCGTERTEDGRVIVEASVRG